jgi:hypothetical protein
MARRKIGRRRTKAEIERAKKRRDSARKYRLKIVHHMTVEQYAGIKEFQGGVCPLCLRANGNTKALAVEHDHRIAENCDHPIDESCENCWRGITCSMCNKFLGFARDDPEFFKRFTEYLLDPPAQLWRRTQ